MRVPPSLSRGSEWRRDRTTERHHRKVRDWAFVPPDGHTPLWEVNLGLPSGWGNRLEKHDFKEGVMEESRTHVENATSPLVIAPKVGFIIPVYGSALVPR